MKPKRILAVSSGGGHWVQLLRLREAFKGHDMAYATVAKVYEPDVDGERFYVVRDATRWNKLGLVLLALQLTWILIRERPDVVLSTGAAPGYVGLRIGKWFGAKTIWLDSIANVQRLSLSGERIGPHADLWLTQWSHLARLDGPHCAGAIL